MIYTVGSYSNAAAWCCSQLEVVMSISGVGRLVSHQVPAGPHARGLGSFLQLLHLRQQSCLPRLPPTLQLRLGIFFNLAIEGLRAGVSSSAG